MEVVDKRGMFQRTVYQSPKYLEFFQPEEQHNPFRHLYVQKRTDVVTLVQEALGERSEARMLDIGGGMGRVAVPLAQQYYVCLADISQAMLDLAQTRAESAHVPAEHLLAKVVDASKALPFDDASFDLVVCLDLLVHLPDPQAAVRELYRVVRPGGTAIIDATNSMPLWVFWYPRYVGKRPGRWVKTLRLGGVLPQWADLVHHYRRSQLWQFLATAGFMVVNERAYGPRICPKWHLAVVRRPEKLAGV